MPRPLRVLLVEDSDDDALLIARELAENGFLPEIERVETAEAMREAIERQTWDIVISDFVLPRFSAMRALALVAEKGIDLPVIIVSGAIGEEMAVATMQAGAHDFIRKGNWARLGPAIERELADAASRRERLRIETERASLALENARLYQEAQEAVRDRNELLATVTHDLKNPLTSISGQAQLLRRQLNQPSGLPVETILDRLTRIEQAAAKMTRMLSDLVDLSRLQLGQPLDLQRRPVNLVALVDSVVWAHQLATEHHQIHLTSPVDELVGEWDPVRIEHVIANLLDNAVKYSPRGGQITVSVHPEGLGEREGAVIDVADQGIGIPADDLPRIFERFQRATNVTGHYAGSGVGLAIARQIVEQHGGTISATSFEGEGTTFTVWLPLGSPDA